MARAHHLRVVLRGLLGLRGLAVLGCGAFVGLWCSMEYGAAVLMAATMAWAAFPFAVMLTERRGVQLGLGVPHDELPLARRERGWIETGVAAGGFALGSAVMILWVQSTSDGFGITAGQGVLNALLVLAAVSPMAVVARRRSSVDGMIVVWTTWILVTGVLFAAVLMGDPATVPGLAFVFVAAGSLAAFGHLLERPLRKTDPGSARLSRPATMHPTLRLIVDGTVGGLSSLGLALGLGLGIIVEIWFETVVGWPLLAGLGYGMLTFPLGLRVAPGAGAYRRMSAAPELLPVSGRRLALGVVAVPAALFAVGIVGTAASGASLGVWEPISGPFGLLVAGGLAVMLASQGALMRAWGRLSLGLVAPPLLAFFALMWVNRRVERSDASLLELYPDIAQQVTLVGWLFLALAAAVLGAAVTSRRLRR